VINTAELSLGAAVRRINKETESVVISKEIKVDIEIVMILIPSIVINYYKCPAAS